MEFGLGGSNPDSSRLESGTLEVGFEPNLLQRPPVLHGVRLSLWYGSCSVSVRPWFHVLAGSYVCVCLSVEVCSVSAFSFFRMWTVSCVCLFVTCSFSCDFGGAGCPSMRL